MEKGRVHCDTDEWQMATPALTKAAKADIVPVKLTGYGFVSMCIFVHRQREHVESWFNNLKLVFNSCALYETHTANLQLSANNFQACPKLCQLTLEAKPSMSELFQWSLVISGLFLPVV